MFISLPSLTPPFPPHLTTSHCPTGVRSLCVSSLVAAFCTTAHPPQALRPTQHLGSCLIFQTQSHMLSHLSLSSCNIVKQTEEQLKLKT